MQKWIITIIAIIGFLGAAPVLSPRGSDDTGVVIVDLGRKLPQNPNPYIIEYEQMLWPTVRIKTPFSTGSGVIFATKELKNRETEEHCYILTAAHVVGDESIVTVELFYPKNIEIEATVIITDTIKDLALLRGLCGSVAKAHLASRDYKPYIFAPVWAVGCSLGLPPRPSQGIITYISDLSVLSGSYWEVSSPILPGNSGGPVYDGRTYEVIGIAVWVNVYQGQLITTMAGVVPINEIYDFLEKGKQENCKSDDAGR